MKENVNRVGGTWPGPGELFFRGWISQHMDFLHNGGLGEP